MNRIPPPEDDGYARPFVDRIRRRTLQRFAAQYPGLKLADVYVKAEGDTAIVTIALPGMQVGTKRGTVVIVPRNVTPEEANAAIDLFIETIPFNEALCGPGTMEETE